VACETAPRQCQDFTNMMLEEAFQKRSQWRTVPGLPSNRPGLCVVIRPYMSQKVVS
jgi:hypothetical protein